MKDFFLNPLFIKQLREEMRSRKIFFLVPVYIAILSSIAMVAVGSNSSTSFDPVSMSNNARTTLFAFVIAVSILLGLIALILGAASFTTERERATYELLELTPLTYTQLVLGKFLHAITIIALILFSSLPVFSTLFFMGGLTYMDLILPVFYLVIFFSVVILGAICISIGSSRTLISIILSLILGFVAYVVLAIGGSDAFREPASMGFAILSPWLVCYRQIFAPISIKLLTLSVPVWIPYVIFYSLLALLLLSWGHNALDTRKLQRNSRARILGLLLLNLYAATGILCVNFYRPVSAKDMEDIYQVLMMSLMATLPFFAIGVFTEQDEKLFGMKPLLQAFNFKNLFRNHPATGPLFLIFLVLTISLNLILCTGVPARTVFGFMFVLLLWIFPWLLLFMAMRLSGLQARGIIVSYVLGMLLLTLTSTFYHSGKSASSIFDFYLISPSLVLLYAVSLSFFAIASLRARKRLRALA